MTWKEEETGLLLVLYDEGFDLSEMANIINSKFGTQYSEQAVGGKLYRLKEKYNLPTRKEIKESKKAISSPKIEEKAVVEEIPTIVEAKVDKPPQPKVSVKSNKVKRMSKKNRGSRHSKKWTVAEDIVLISHYGRLPDDELENELGRSISGIQYRYRMIANDKSYVGSLVVAGLENGNLGVIAKEHFEPQEKKPSWFKRWKLRRLAKKQERARAKVAKLNRALKKMEE